MSSQAAGLAYRIGTPGVPWGSAEKSAWLAGTDVQRSYQDEVVRKLAPLRTSPAFDVVEYGALNYDPTAPPLPLLAVQSKPWDPRKPCVLVTGGVHGYETSGVQGALLFLETEAARYCEHVNLLVAPCVSPWGYERVQRWNAEAVDPNRSFQSGESCGLPSAEANALKRLVASCDTAAQGGWTVHVDLHETTDSDESEFRPAKAARDGEASEPDTVPDGFYLVGDALKPQPAWHTAIVDAVRAVAPIAPPDAANNLIGEPMAQPGVIYYPCKKLGLCASVADAAYATTTEVYPDGASASAEQCNAAQVAALVGALDYVLKEIEAK